MFKKTEHTDICIRTTDGNELWHSTYMLTANSHLIHRHIIAKSLRIDESRLVVEALLMTIEGRDIPINELSYRTYQLAKKLGFDSAAHTIRKRLMREPTIEFLQGERGEHDFGRALTRYMTRTNHNSDLLGCAIREYQKLLEVTKKAREQVRSQLHVSALRTLNDYFESQKIK